VVKFGNKCHFKNDILEGEFIEYYENGNIYEKCYYKNDILEGKILSSMENFME
jgi:antitoxin component YwqK of YwqJK toxin-antitoxin module